MVTDVAAMIPRPDQSKAITTAATHRHDHHRPIASLLGAPGPVVWVPVGRKAGHDCGQRLAKQAWRIGGLTNGRA